MTHLAKTCWLLITLIFIWSKPSMGQELSFPADPIVVVNEQGESITNPFAGGLNAPQFNSLDLNGDGVLDLVLFDRSANKISTFIYENDKWNYAPHYEYQFPDNLFNWVLLRDFDCDGRKDLFTSTSLGIKVYRNETEDAGALSWTLVEDPILTLGNDLINLFVNTTDLPAIHDVDGDGDLDVLVFNFATGGFIEFHQNNAIEETGSCGLGPFVRVTRTWGDFQECICGIFAFGDEECPANNRIQHSAGKALTLFDHNEDGNPDIFFGEELCPSLFQLSNLADGENALFRNASARYTAAQQELLFPAVYFLEASPGLDDGNVIVSSNARANIINQQDWKHSIYQFQRENGNWSLSTNAFLQDQMVEVGENAHPAFGDIDGDGDHDLIIGNRGSLINGAFTASIAVYENTGNVFEPEFTWLTNDFLWLSGNQWLNIKPTFYDLNKDGIKDLVFSALEGNRNKLLMIPGSEEGFRESQLESFDVPFNELDDFTLIDMNEDELPDLLVGTSSGRLDQYINVGSVSEPVFSLETRGFLSIETDPSRTYLSTTVYPERETSLYLYDDSGEIRLVENFLSPNPTIKTLSLEQPITTTRLGRIGALALSPLSPGKTALVIGNSQGGLQLLTLNETESQPGEDWSISLFPNPTKHRLNILTSRNATGQLVSLSGKILMKDLPLSESQINRLDLRNLSQGLYLLQVENSSVKKTLKVLIHE